jgi:predicted transcriptional regulator YdeE
MNIEIVEQPEFQVCGYVLDTDLEQYGRKANREELFANFYKDGRAEIIAAIAENPTEFYALAWFSGPDRRIYYLLGQLVRSPVTIPEGAVLKTVKGTTYARGRFDGEEDIEREWTNFYYQVNSGYGYVPDYQSDVWFERYPAGLTGHYELNIAVTIRTKED